MPEREKPQVLIVDDESLILFVIQSALEGADGLPVDVLTAGGIQQAKEVIRESMLDGRRRITAVLTDWNMDEGTGAEVIEAARKVGIVSVGVMTAGTQERQKEIQRTTGAQLILEKPVEIEDVRKAIALLAGLQIRV